MSHLSQAFTNNEVLFMRSEMLSPPLRVSCDVFIHFQVFVLAVLENIEAQYWFALSFVFSELFPSGSGF